jgi:ParB/RepB/Spo0J family partition protein
MLDQEETTTVGAITKVCATCKGEGGSHFSGCAALYGDAPEPERKSSSPAAARYEPAVPLKSIRPSPFNHRKHFTGLEELAASIKEKGLINPPMVRPANGLIATKPKSKRKSPGDTTEIALEDFELVAGERRWRAASLAGLTTIPVIVRELSDVEVLEIQLVENVQRSDVHPLEEADGYRDLMERHGYTVDKIADKTGKSKATIYARLKLCDLAPKARDAFLEDKIAPSIALLIARIPVPELQEKAARAVLGEEVKDLDNDEALWDRPHFKVEDDKGKVRAEPIPMSVREAAAFIQTAFMLRLELATFDPADELLVPGAGACTGCVHRTGNQPTLFGDVKGADVCTRPPCYKSKTDAAWTIRARAAEAAGRTVLTAEQSEKVFSGNHLSNGGLGHDSKYVDPKAEVGWDVLGNDFQGKRPTWGKLLGKEAKNVKGVLAKDPSGAGRELLEKKSAIEVLRSSGKLEEEKKARGPSGPSPAEKKKLEQAKRDKAVETRAVELALEFFHKKGAEPFPAKKEAAIWGWLAQVMITCGLDSYYAAEPMLQRRRAAGVIAERDEDASLDDLVEGKSGSEARGLLVEFAASVAQDVRTHSGLAGAMWERGLLLFGLDWTKLLAAAEAELGEPEPAAKGKGGKKGASKR